MTSDDICYTGIGALKSGNHTKKQFLTIMDKTSKKDCPEHIKFVKCKSCQKLKRMVTLNVKNK